MPQHRQARAFLARDFGCRCARFREPGPSIVNSHPVSRTEFADSEPQPPLRAVFPGVSSREASDTFASIFGPDQFANSAHFKASTQTWSQHAHDNPSERHDAARGPFHETRRTDIGNIHLPPPLLTPPRFFIV
jgi:hypothetical protein